MPERFNHVKKGYDPSQVDNYINSLEIQLDIYKEKDDAIKNAIINAQIAADNIIKNAEIESLNMKRKAAILLSEISGSITAQRQIVKNFQTDYNNILGKYIHKINENEISQVYAKIDELENFIVKLQKIKSEDAAEKKDTEESSENKPAPEVKENMKPQ